jgi:hypothetical protein
MYLPYMCCSIPNIIYWVTSSIENYCLDFLFLFLSFYLGGKYIGILYRTSIFFPLIIFTMFFLDLSSNIQLPTVRAIKTNSRNFGVDGTIHHTNIEIMSAVANANKGVVH